MSEMMNPMSGETRPEVPSPAIGPGVPGAIVPDAIVPGAMSDGLDREARDARIEELVLMSGGDPESFEGRLVEEMVRTALRLLREGHDTGQIKLINSALKEMRYAYRVFNQYTTVRKVTIFGSARTPEDHPDYAAAREFSRLMAVNEWMCITGAGDGIMKAGHEGPQREASFGLSIRLPFETTANEVIEGDPKLINFRYFFTRKLMFVSHADAVAVFPGGFGTQDELFEALTLVQTGKSNIVPIVLLEGRHEHYWKHWLKYIEKNLLEERFISPEDRSIFHIASTPEEAVEHVLQFYRVYHSSRYVGPMLVIRLRQALTPAQLAQVNDEFASLVRSGAMELSGPLEGERDHLNMPRLVFDHHRHQYGKLRQLIDRINTFAG